MAEYNMNRYRRGSSATVASRFGAVAAQLKVENPPPLRTIGHLIFARVLSLQGNAFYSEILIKKSNRRYRTGGDTNIARKKSARGKVSSTRTAAAPECGYESGTRKGIAETPDAADLHRIQN
jgi:hypothetical protein